MGNLTDEQKATLTEALKKPISDRELFEKLDSVEEGSFCSSNDACYHSMVSYYILSECSKAWH